MIPLNSKFANASRASSSARFFGTPATSSIRWLCMCLACAALGAPISTRAANIAGEGTGILGVNNAIDSDAGTPRLHAGVAANINDGDPGTAIDTWFGDGGTDKGQAISFVGILWPAKRFDKIQSLTLTMATFFDGGWFGKKNSGPGPGGLLTPSYLIEPTIQVSTNGGVTWSSVAATSDYMTVLNGFSIGGGANVNPTSVATVFTLATPATEINGIRIIGENGGTADGNGFIGVFELEVQAEPSADNDGDGMLDSWEIANGLKVGINDASEDPDGDGLTNLEEFTAGTDPHKADTDGDGLSDSQEVKTTLTNPVLADTDGDGLSDGKEVNETKTDPHLVDTDGDGLSDGAEVNTLHTNPLVADTDGDGYSDGAEIAEGSDPNSPTSIPTNIAPSGVPFLGIKDSLDGGIENEIEFYHVGLAGSINDGDLTTRVDTYNDAGTTTVSYVGVLWDQPITSKLARIELTMATFLDGGWFGVNNHGPGAGGKLTTNDLAEPRIETTTDGGATWTTAASTSDYNTALLGHGIGGGLNPNPTSVKVTFTLTTPTSGINGVRVIGTEGGTASGGFLGVIELAAHISAPAAPGDTDGDGMDDAWERKHGLNVGVNDAGLDADNDGLTNLQEFTAGTDPQVADTDGDGLNDGAEVNQYKTNPLQTDTDGDGLSDGQEVTVSKTNPTKTDSDGDGYVDPAEVILGTDPNSASSTPTDIALLGTAILGVKDAVDSGTDTPLFNAGATSSINDGNLTTRVDTFNGGGTTTASYVGILWDKPITTPIVRLELNLAIFFDGGWFGVGGVSPGSGGVLSATDNLVAPMVQVTTDKGTNWTTIAATSDYMTALDGQPLPAVDFGDPTTAKATFQLTTPQANINGIRLIGTEGGVASGGFLGVFELAAHTGTPASNGQISLANAARVNNQFRFEFDSKSGTSYVIQYKNALSDAAWQTLTTIPGDGTRKQVTDALTGGQRFYRVSGP